VTGAPLGERERIAWLRLARAEAVGPVTFAHLIGRYGSAARAIVGVSFMDANRSRRAAG